MVIKQVSVGAMTTSTFSEPKPQMCFTCKTRKGGIFGVDPNGRPVCFDCMPERDKEVHRAGNA